jgi:hypothetical protein
MAQGRPACARPWPFAINAQRPPIGKTPAADSYFYRRLFVNERIPISFLLLIAFVRGLSPAPVETPRIYSDSAQSPSQKNSNPVPGARAQIAGGIENNNGQLRLNLTNNSTREFRGEGIIAIGDDLEKREIGQITLSIAPQETKLFQINGGYEPGPQFSLRIFDQSGALAYYKIGPIKSVSDSTPALVVTLRPVSSSKKPGARLPTAAPSTLGAQPPPRAEEPPVVAEVTITGRLLADRTKPGRLLIAIEMSAPRPINGATLAISAGAMGKFKDRKPVDLRQTQTVEFKLPDPFDAERIGYELTAKTGRVIAKGELDVGRLMAEDSVTVTGVRLDKTSYEPGDSVQVTVLLGGKSPNGFRLEAQVLDGQGGVIFQDRRQGGANDPANAQSFTLTLPRELGASVNFGFNVYDGETGLLFDSGEREIPIKKPERRP